MNTDASERGIERLIYTVTTHGPEDLLDRAARHRGRPV